MQVLENLTETRNLKAVANYNLQLISNCSIEFGYTVHCTYLL